MRRSPGGRPRTSGTASGCSGRPSARPFRPSTPWRAASTTSATVGASGAKAASSWPGCVTVPSSDPAPRPKIRCWWPWPPPRTSTTAAGGLRRAHRRLRGTCRGTSYATFDDLVGYCRLVAGSIGGSRWPYSAPPTRGGRTGRQPRGGPSAHQHPARRPRRPGNGRVYLPAADAVAVGCPPDLSGDAERSWPTWWHSSAPGCTSGSSGDCSCFPLLNRRSRACVGAMAGIYRRLLLSRIERDPIGRDRSAGSRCRRPKGVDRRQVHRRGHGHERPPGGGDRWRVGRDQRRPDAGRCRGTRSRCWSGARGSAG